MNKNSIRGMILAAGLGTRLKPFTDKHPKALFEVDGKTLLQHAVEHLQTYGIKEVIVNVHHFADQIITYLYQNKYFGLKITISDESGELLETGGGVKKASWFLTECDGAIVRNVDILSDLDLSQMAGYHFRSGALATLAARNRSTSRYLLFDRDMTLCGWKNINTGEHQLSRQTEITTPYAFSGIQVLSPALFPLITETGKFSLTDLYLRLAAQNRIAGYVEDGNLWKDLGKMTRDA